MIMFLEARIAARPARPVPSMGLGLIAAVFAAGLAIGAAVGWSGRLDAAAEPPPARQEKPAAASTVRLGQRAEVLRVYDGDTFEARVHLWPGLEVTTRVRLRGIDTPEMNARCSDERARALAARNALSHLLAQGDVAIGRVTPDKYGGRVVADVVTRSTPDVSRALIEAGLARRYDGGRRESWCG